MIWVFALGRLILIYNEIVAAEKDGLQTDIAYMIDQNHFVKTKVEAMIQSVVNIQMAYARALLVDQVALVEAQAADDTVRGEEVLRYAFDTDVRPLLARIPLELGAAADPIGTYRQSGYYDPIAVERQGELEGAASWGG